MFIVEKVMQIILNWKTFLFIFIHNYFYYIKQFIYMLLLLFILFLFVRYDGKYNGQFIYL